jgi:gamma-glutamylaminecyclotransferase
MCVIIVKKKGLRVPTDVLKSSARINPHGLGIVWLDDYSVSYHKSTEYNLLDTERPFVAHFRYATVGAINRANTHPFVCGSNANELLMMNGTIKGLGNKKKSDSKELAELLGEMPRHVWKSELERYDCRFITLNVRNKSYQMYNRQDWHNKDGIWYSKDNVLETNVVAVYGTLKIGYSNYWNYLSGASCFVGKGNTSDKYPLIIQGLPYLINDKGLGHNVDVDVFKVTDKVLERLDILEGHPKWYRREQIYIDVKGKKVLAWIYFNLRETSTGKKHHKSYVQNQFRDYQSYNKPTHNYNKWQVPTAKINQTLFDDFKDIPELDDEFDVDNETPMCVACYNDLVFDGFNLYHCQQCNTWHKEGEVLKKFNY